MNERTFLPRDFFLHSSISILEFTVSNGFCFQVTFYLTTESEVGSGFEPL